jgi:hypothetical protein
VPPLGPFRAVVRYWDPAKGSGLAVVDLPAEVTSALGGLKQMKVRGTVNGAAFKSNTMPAGGGRLALSCSKALLGAGKATVGSEVELTIERV